MKTTLQLHNCEWQCKTCMLEGLSFLVSQSYCFVFIRQREELYFFKQSYHVKRKKGYPQICILENISIRVSKVSCCDLATFQVGNNWHLYNIGWPWGAYKNILPEMLTILPESMTRVILLASRAIYSCIPRKRAIQYYHYYSYRALCVILLSNDRGWLPAAILSSHES